MPAHISAPDPESIPSHNRHRRSPPTRRPRQPSLPIAIWIAAGTLALFVLIPLAALLLRAAGHSGSATDETWRTLRQALRLTAITSCLSLLLVTALGTPLAFILARRRFRGSRLLDALIDLPMILPPAVAGIALLMAFGRRGLVGEPLDRIGITVGFSGVAVVIAQTFVSAPFYVRTARAGFARIDAALEESAADLGASPGAVLRTVTLPLAAPSLAAGAALAWARAVGEFGATILFAGNLPGRTQTMSLAIYGRYEAGDLDTALILAAILLGASLAVLLGTRLVGGRSAP